MCIQLVHKTDVMYSKNVSQQLTTWHIAHYSRVSWKEHAMIIRRQIEFDSSIPRCVIVYSSLSSKKWCAAHAMMSSGRLVAEYRLDLSYCGIDTTVQGGILVPPGIRVSITHQCRQNKPIKIQFSIACPTIWNIWEENINMAIIQISWLHSHNIYNALNYNEYVHERHIEMVNSLTYLWRVAIQCSSSI